jgi:phosphatidate phosphatase PAH1
VPIVGLMAGAVCVGVAEAELELETVEDLLVLLLFTVLNVDEALVSTRDDVEVVELRDDELLAFEVEVDFNVEDDVFEVVEPTDFTVDVVVEEDLTELDVDVLDVVESFTDVELELLTSDVAELEVLVADCPSMYISNLFPAPQYSYELPGHTKEQSDKDARTEPALITLPQ